MTWATAHRDTLVAFARDYQRGVAWLYDPAHKQQAIDVLVKRTHQSRRTLKKRTTIWSPS